MDFKTVREKLEYIQKREKETFLFPILKQLFSKDYVDVNITHGNAEFGKDLVFKEYDSKLQTERWFAVIVKNHNATQSDFEMGGDILRQINSSFACPYVDSKGKEHYINCVIVLLNGSVTFHAKNILAKSLQPSHLTNVEIWNYQRLSEEIDKKIKDEFLHDNKGVLDDYQIISNTFKKRQIDKLSNLKNSRELFQGLEISDINDIFVNVKTTYNKYTKTKNSYISYDKMDISQAKQEEIDESLLILNSNSNFIIHGIAASGKSLLLKRIAINALR